MLVVPADACIEWSNVRVPREDPVMGVVDGHALQFTWNGRAYQMIDSRNMEEFWDVVAGEVVLIDMRAYLETLSR